MRDPAKVEKLKTAVERNVKAIGLRPSIGQGTAVTKVRVRDACTAEIEDGGWKLIADESVKDGGNGEGPDSGVYGRAALGSCMAIGYAMWSAKLGVPFDSIEVDVEADYDARGMFGVDDSVPPGWTGLRVIVRVESSAPEDEVRRAIEFADAHSPLLYDFSQPIQVEREINVSARVQ
ncbi:MAG: OsmC family protein [Dehalococcoidia bacterium]